jgi:hypothetical protein
VPIGPAAARLPPVVLLLVCFLVGVGWVLGWGLCLTSIHPYACTRVCVYTHTHTHIYIYTCIDICMYVHKHVYVYVCARTLMASAALSSSTSRTSLREGDHR